MFFVDAFDLSKSYDQTREEARRIVKLAQNNSHYDTKYMRKCLNNKWRDRKDRLITMQLRMLSDEIFTSLGDAEKSYFTEKSNSILSQLKNDEDAMEMSQYDFEQLEVDLRETKSAAINMNLKRLRGDQENSELQRVLAAELAGEESERAKREWRKAEEAKRHREREI